MCEEREEAPSCFFGHTVEEVDQKCNDYDDDDDVTSLHKRNLWGLLTSMQIWGGDL